MKLFQTNWRERNWGGMKAIQVQVPNTRADEIQTKENPSDILSP